MLATRGSQGGMLYSKTPTNRSPLLLRRERQRTRTHHPGSPDLLFFQYETAKYSRRRIFLLRFRKFDSDSDFRFQISDFSRRKISDFRFQISDFRFQISDFRFQIQIPPPPPRAYTPIRARGGGRNRNRNRNLESGIWNLESGIWNLFSGICFLESNFRIQTR